MQRCRNGQECPPAVTLVGSVQIPNGTATCPICSRTASVSRQGGRTGPDPVAVGVDLQRAEPVLGFARAFGGDPVVAHRGAYRVVAQSAP